MTRLVSKRVFAAAAGNLRRTCNGWVLLWIRGIGRGNDRVRGRIRVCVALVLALADAASATDYWTNVAAVGEVKVRVHWVSRGELVAAARSVGQSATSTPLGFSVLSKSRETGEYFCDVYLAKRPARSGDQATGTLGHEIAHCLGFTHE